MTVATLCGVSESAVPPSPGPLRPSRVQPVPVPAIARAVGGTVPDTDVMVTGLSMSAGLVRPGDMYAGVPGARTHGARFVDEARDRGAVALLTDRDGVRHAAAPDLPTIVVQRPRSALGAAAALIYAYPARALTLIAVTGTQGKTTTTQLVARGLEAAGTPTAVVGTMGTWIRSEPVSSALTTPEAPDLHALFAVMRERGVSVCAMEVSSHALVMRRVDGVVFDLAVFTNFGRDHLDFHHTVEQYFAAKADLFTPERSRRALLNADDAEVARLAVDPQIPTRTFSRDPDSGADWYVTGITATPDGSRFEVVGPDGAVNAGTRLAGAFNITNTLAGLAAVGEAGLDVAAAARGIAAVEAVPGRMQRVDRGQDFSVIVDYAHKPDAVAAALESLRPVTRGRLVIVLGAGGDRDRGKRRQMGEIAARMADTLVVTDDNPRSEEPASIRAEIIAGAEAVEDADVRDVGDRRTAIEEALRGAAPGDTVLIAGKGHETGQQLHDRLLPFDDRAVAAEVLDAIQGRDRP